MGIDDGAIHYPAFKTSIHYRCLYDVTYWPQTAMQISMACLFPWLSFLTECFEMTSTGLLMSYRMNLCDVFMWEKSTRMWECTLCQRLGRNDHCICLNPNYLMWYNILWYILPVFSVLWELGGISCIKSSCVSLHNVHLSFFHCKWMCTMAVFYIQSIYGK